MRSINAPGAWLACWVVLMAGCTHGLVPVGGVVDWYRPNPSTPVPPGYVLADGSVVSDPDSPLVNQRVPDLRTRYVRGASEQAQVGASGGFAAHSHGLSQEPFNTGDVVEPDHTHQWAKFEKGSKRWTTYSGNNEVRLVDWGDGLDSEGSGIYPLAFEDASLANVTGTVYLTTTKQAGTTLHHHEVRPPPGANTTLVSNDPPHVFLWKIVRIK